MPIPPTLDSEDVLIRAEYAAKDRLESWTLFSDAIVVAFDDGDLGQRVEIAIAKLRLLVLIASIEASVPSPNLPGPEIEVKTIIQVSELGILNRGASGTQRTARRMAQLAAARLHQYQHPNLAGAFFVKEAINPGQIIFGILPKDKEDITPTWNFSIISRDLITYNNAIVT